MVYITDLESRFTFKEEIGKGSYGEITRGVDNSTSLPVVRKRITNGKSAIQEISIYSIIDYPNIAKLIAWTYTKSEWVLIFHEGIPIEKAIKARQITLDQCIWELLNVVNFLHSNGIYHGDLKPANVIYLDGKLTLIDFGSARIATKHQDKFLVKGLSPTVGYIDPEYSQTDWNPINCELYSVAGIIWNLRKLSKGVAQEILHRKIYQFVCSESRNNDLFTELTKFPLSERKDISQIIRNWYGIEPLEAGRVIQKHSRIIPTDPAYRKIVEKLFSIFYERGNSHLIPAWQMFLGIGLFRNVLEKIFPNYSSRLTESIGLGVTCIYLIGIITGTDLRISYDWIISIKESFVGEILRIMDDNLIVETDWDRAESYEELVYYTPGLFGFEILPTKRIIGQSKHIYFYKVLEGTILPTQEDFSIQKRSYQSFVNELDCKINHLQKPTDLESHIQHIACYFILHHRDFLSELNYLRGQKVYDTLAKHIIGSMILDIITDYPLKRFEGTRLHPFKVKQETSKNLDLCAVD